MRGFLPILGVSTALVLMTKPYTDFAPVNVDELESAAKKLVEDELGRTIYPADPVYLLIKSLLAIIIQQRRLIDWSAKQNLLAFAEGNYLDCLGQLVGVTRHAQSYATTTVEVRLSAAREQVTTINQGTRVTADNQIFFALDDELIFLPGETVKTCAATCLTAGTAGNGFAAGELNKIVDPQAFLLSIVNTTTSDGGADTEDDESLRERIHIAPEAFSCAGSEGAYIARTKEVSALISDVAVTSPQPGYVDIYVLCQNGKLPTEELLQAIDEHLNAKTIRPLTDKVSIKAPLQTMYSIDVTIYIANEARSQAAQIIDDCSAAVQSYIEWQSERLGRDITPSRLIYLIIASGAKRVEIREPAFTVIDPTAVAICAGTRIDFAYEDF